MADQKKSGSFFGLGLVLGSVLGGLTAFFLSPKSGKENREEVAKKIQELKKLLEEKQIDEIVKDIFGEVTAEAKKAYLGAKEMLIHKLALLKENVKDINKDKYLLLLEEVIAEFKKEAKHTGKVAERLKEQLSSDWKKLNKEK